MKRILPLIVCILLCLAAGCAKPAPDAQQPTDAPIEPTEAPTETPAEPTGAPETDVPETGAPAPQADLSFEATALSGGTVSSEIIKDYDLVIVNFWAEWCGPCVEELPALEQIHQAYPNVLILGAWLGDDADDAIETLLDAGVTYPAVYPEGTLIDYSGKSMYIPATYFFDKTGTEIGEPVIGGQDYSEWKTTVEKLLP